MRFNNLFDFKIRRRNENRISVGPANLGMISREELGIRTPLFELTKLANWNLIISILFSIWLFEKLEKKWICTIDLVATVARQCRRWALAIVAATIATTRYHCCYLLSLLLLATNAICCHCCCSLPTAAAVAHCRCCLPLLLLLPVNAVGRYCCSCRSLLLFLHYQLFLSMMMMMQLLLLKNLLW